MGFGSTLNKHKYLIGVGCLCTAFAVATIVLAVEVDRLNGVVSDLTPDVTMPDTTTPDTTTPDATTTESGPKEPWQTDYRLPDDLQPESYDLTLHPDFSQGTFTGRVIITILTGTVARDYILVHKKYMNISSTVLTLQGTTLDLVEDTFDYEPNEFWVVRPSAPLATEQRYELTLNFDGSLQGKIVGFYESVYTSADGSPKTIATSKFQPTYARQAFPCFDEPSFKSKFTTHLVRPTDDYHALSNMNVADEIADSPAVGLTTVNFAESVNMVTYLACFIVSDFESLPPIQVDNPTAADTFPFSVYATPAQTAAGKTQFALDTGVAVVNHYITYFDLAYPLPKLDMIAIPDFVSGAMEHWGLITFREVNLLYSDDVSSTANRQRVAAVIAHELAHMWFGNLVTLKWWDDLWLNEGFASYMEYKGVNSAHADWEMMDQFLVEDLHPVLKLDAVLSSHPIVQTVGHPDQITELFDTISYNKGAAVIRMLENFLGESNFQKGIQSFLHKYQLSNAVTQDLWDALQEVANLDTTLNGLDVTKVMDTWTRQMGFPVVMVKRVNGNFELTQERFLADPNANTTGDDSPYEYKWEIPINYNTDACVGCVQVGHSTWLSASQDEPLTIPIPSGSAWVKFNFQQIGYYRVNYESADWKTFSDLLVDNPTGLNIADRSHLLDDVFSLADASTISYDVALDMSKYLVNELDYVPWSVASSKLSALNSILADSLGFKNLRTYVQSLVRNVYEDVGWTVNLETENHMRLRTRVTVLDLACSLGLEECLSEVGQNFVEWISNPANRPAPDVRSIVYYNGMASVGNEANWNTMWQLYLDEQDAQEKIKLMYGLAAVKEPWLLRRYVQLAKNEAYIRSQDYFTVLTYISGNPIGTPIVWDFVRAEWEYLVDRFGLNERYLGRLIPSITSSFTTQLKLEEMKAFFTKYPEAGAGTVARAQALETVQNRITWLNRNEDTINVWLENAVSKLRTHKV